jgi:Domain of unknown function (DUF4136)
MTAGTELRRAALVTIGLALGMLGCASSTKMLSSSTTPDFRPGSVKKVFVVGVAQNNSLRRVFEDSFVNDLKRDKYDGEASYTRIPDPDPKKIDKDAVAAALVKDGFTHVLVTRLVSVEDRETYVPPTTMAVGVGYGGYGGYYGGWYPYMSMSYGYVTSPGYTTVDRVVCLETNIYDLATQKLIWTGQTETWVDKSAEDSVRKVIYAVTWDLRAKKVI